MFNTTLAKLESNSAKMTSSYNRQLLGFSVVKEEVDLPLVDDYTIQYNNNYILVISNVQSHTVYMYI